MAICQMRSRIAMNATGRSQIFRADKLNFCSCLVAVTLGGFLMRQQSACAKSGNQRNTILHSRQGLPECHPSKRGQLSPSSVGECGVVIRTINLTQLLSLSCSRRKDQPPKLSELDWTQRPRSSRRILSSHPQSSAKEGQFLARFGILSHAIDACPHKRKQDAQEKPILPKRQA